MKKHLKLKFLLLFCVPILNGCANSEQTISVNEFEKFASEHLKTEIKSATCLSVETVTEVSGVFEARSCGTSSFESITNVEPFSLIEFEIIKGKNAGNDNFRIVKGSDYFKLNYALPASYYYDGFFPDITEDSSEAVKEANEEINSLTGFVNIDAKYNFDGYPEYVNSDFDVNLLNAEKTEIDSYFKEEIRQNFSNYTEAVSEEDFANNTDSSNVEASQGLYANNWMNFIAGDTPITRINLPGTHDSSTFGLSYIIGIGLPKTQKYDYYEQLKRGVRFFDLRTFYHAKFEHYDYQANSDVYDRITFCHGNEAPPSSMFYNCRYRANDGKDYILSFRILLNFVNRFLNENPSEFVVFQFQPEIDKFYDENGKQWTKNSLANETFEAAKALVNSNPSRYMVFDNVLNGSKIPTLEECRGKICMSFDCCYGHNIVGENCQVCNDYSAGPYAKKDALANTFNNSLNWNDFIETKPKAAFLTTKDSNYVEPRIIHCSCYRDVKKGIMNPLSCSDRVNPFVKKFDLATNKYYGWVLFDYVDYDEAYKIYINNKFIPTPYIDYVPWPINDIQQLISENYSCSTIIPSVPNCIHVNLDTSSLSSNKTFKIECKSTSFNVQNNFVNALKADGWIEENGVYHDPWFKISATVATKQTLAEEFTINIFKCEKTVWPIDSVRDCYFKVIGNNASDIPEFNSQEYTVKYDETTSTGLITGKVDKSNIVDFYSSALKKDNWTVTFDDSIGKYTAINEYKDAKLTFWLDTSNYVFNILIEKYMEFVDQWPSSEIASMVSNLGATGEVLPFNSDILGVSLNPSTDFAPAIYVKTSGNLFDKAMAYNNYLQNQGYETSGQFRGYTIYSYPGTTLAYGAAFITGNDFITIYLLLN